MLDYSTEALTMSKKRVRKRGKHVQLRGKKNKKFTVKVGGMDYMGI